MKQSRREFIKTNAISATAAAAGIAIPGMKVIAEEADNGVRWDKAPCRFCGTGCSVLVGTKDGRVVATQVTGCCSQPWIELHQGLLPFKIMYADDRLTQPLLRKKNGKFDKEGRLRAGILG